MSASLIVAAVLFSLFIIIFVCILLRKKRINIKYSLIWLILFFLLLVATLMPNFLVSLTRFLGFQTASNMIFSLIISVLVIITIALTVIVSNQDKKIRLLVQELSILKSKDKKNEK